jgi:predicted ABC-type sugar transport system permease subunit
MGQEGPQPTFSERARMPLRVAAVVVGYGIYRVFEPTTLPGGICLGVGFMLTAWAVIERFTTWRHERLDMMVFAQGLLGIGLLIAGGFLVLR